jgi:hypothetical protein
MTIYHNQSVVSKAGAEQLAQTEALFDKVYDQLGEAAYNKMCNDWNSALTVKQRTAVISFWAPRVR